MTEIFVITVKRLEPLTYCVRDHDATTTPACERCERHDL